MKNIVLQENKSNNFKRKRGNNISSYFSPSPPKKEYLLDEKTAKSLVSTQRKEASCYSELTFDDARSDINEALYVSNKNVIDDTYKIS